MLRSIGPIFCLVLTALAAVPSLAAESAPPAGISFQRDVQPILAQHCQGCHQPAKPQGDYVLTTGESLFSAGESGSAPIVAGDPDASYLMQQIVPVDGYAEMPRDAAPLSEAEIETIRQWIAAGAPDDSPADGGPAYSNDNPPRYTQPPIITSLDYAPDGQLLAVSGFHEVLLVQPSTGETVGRLIGMSKRIESVRFSPDGKRLAVSGGLPGRMGEVQVWDVASRELLLSKPVTYDTVYGVSWSPDGSMIAFGCADNTVRAMKAETGEQVLFQGAHNDWVRDTVFTADGSHIVSVGRDMTAKLTEVATDRFVDNVTSITPGALRGGMNAIARHPERDEVLVGGADGVPKVFRVFRQTERRIGDDANLIREFAPMKGRIFNVAISDDGSKLAAASTLDGQGHVAIYAYNFDGTLSDELKAILAKRVADRKPEEKKKVEASRTEGIEQLAQIEIPEASIYAIAFSADGTIAAAGSDGLIRLFDAQTGEKQTELMPVALQPETDVERVHVASTSDGQRQTGDDAGQESLPEGLVIEELRVEPQQLIFSGPFATAQLVVHGRTADGAWLDVSRAVAYQPTAETVVVDAGGFVRPVASGAGTIAITLEGLSHDIPVKVDGLEQPPSVDFVRDVNPVLTRLGCNQGTCHGSAKGKNGFKLSLRGYDPIFDVRGFSDDLAGRRVNFASPDDSLMLMKTSGRVPHEGGVLMKSEDASYRIVRRWIADGAQLDTNVPRVASIRVSPQNPVVPREGMKQQIRVVATYDDGSERDVTRLAFVSSGNTEIAEAEANGLLSALRRGEAAVLVRYEGAYAATTLTVMGDREGFSWEEPEKWGEIDRLVAKKWQRMKILPSELCTDEEFIRRATLDLTGLPPTVADVRAFVADGRDVREKRAALIDHLMATDAFVDRWTNKWADLLQVNRKFLGVEGAEKLRGWIRRRVADNTPYDQFVREIVAASGSNNDNPAASYYKILRTPEELVENTTHLFLGVRFNCNKCHDHPFERWTQDQYYELAAYFARVDRTRDPASGNRKVGGTAVESATPLFEKIADTDAGEVMHQRTGEVAKPQFPYECDYETDEEASRREALSAWLTSRDNPYFARSFANRIWSYLMGVGIMEPVDDLRAGNPPTNPELMDYLTEQFLASDFDVRQLIRLICNSRTYGLSIETNQWNADDKLNYSHAQPRRLPAEMLYDAVYTALGAQSTIPGVPAGTRAAQLPDAGVKLADNFLVNLGKPVRESACECERSSDMQLGSVMAMVSGPTIASAISDPKNALPTLVADIEDDRKLVDELFMRLLSRPASDQEIDAALQLLPEIDADHEQLTRELAEREAWWKEERARREQQRLAEIEGTKAEIERVTEERKPERERLEAERADRIAAAEKAIADYRSKMAQKNDAYFADRLKETVEWFPLLPASLDGGKETTLTAQDDRSILAAGSAEKGVYKLTFKTSLSEITGLRLEALSDPNLPSSGPGLPQNGNFVVTELQVAAKAAGSNTEPAAVAVVSATADYAQEGFDINQTFDGKTGDQRGWAVSPATGITHWATFQFAEPIAHEGMTELSITLHQNHNAKQHLLGRFRISVTTADGEIPVGLPEDLASVAAIAKAERSEKQAAILATYRDKTDPELVKLHAALAEARKPVPEFPKIIALNESLKYLEQPVADDPRLVRLRADLKQSEKQREVKRLTMLQDLAWALINSPSFLFNR